MEVSPQVKNQLTQFQQLQGQLQGIGAQRYQLEMVEKDIEYTLEELGKVKDSAPIFKSIGSIMVKAESVKAIKGELEDKKETNKVRIKALQKQEDSLKERYQTLQEQLSKALQGAQPPADDTA